MERLEGSSLHGLPAPRSQSESDLFAALTIMFLSPRDADRARAAVRAAVGDATFELLVAYLAFIRTAHYWTEMHPELTYEPDMAELLRGHGELAELLLDASEAELVKGGMRLRDTLQQLRRTESALVDSESRHAFLLKLGDALRVLSDPVAIQGEASRLLGEGLLTDRACYADIDDALGVVQIERNHLRSAVPSLVGRYSLGDFTWVSGALGSGGAAVVGDVGRSPLIPDAVRRAIAELAVGAFIAAPLVKDGRLVAALCVTDVSPRVWTAEEVELVKDTAQRTWDAIDRARAEEQLRQADARKDEFLAMLAHELRNPLAPIRAALELIRRRGDSVAAIEELRPMMERQVGHMVRLVDDLLDVSRITSGKIALQREVTPLADLVHGAVEANRAAIVGKDLDFRVVLPTHQCLIDADPTRLVQIMSNVLNNAVKFTPHGGSVSISATVEGDIATDPPHVSISVVDSGIGIAPQLLPQVFDLFTQGETGSAQSGLGIGLALVRRLVELHGGRIDVRSEGQGKGSEFVVRLPLAASGSVSAAGAPGKERSLDRRVLVVDDYRDGANATARLVEAMGGDARVAYDGESALQALHEFRPEVVLLDIGMPGLDGFETCRRIRAVLGDRVLLVALTGFGQEQDKERALRAGFDAHVTKPADGAKLAAILAQRSTQGA